MSKALIALMVVWLSVVGTGMGILWNYGQTPGAGGAPPLQWPSRSSIQTASGMPTLVMFAHPYCPCTRASLGELSRLMTLCRGLVAARVLFVEPAGRSDHWGKTDLWEEAAAIPGVAVVRDIQGAEARLFGSVTSGQTALYDAGGRLLYSGGITLTRGHRGDNPGRGAIVALLTRQTAPGTASPVFGCSLLTPGSNSINKVAP